MKLFEGYVLQVLSVCLHLSVLPLLGPYSVYLILLGCDLIADFVPERAIPPGELFKLLDLVEVQFLAWQLLVNRVLSCFETLPLGGSSSRVGHSWSWHKWIWVRLPKGRLRLRPLLLNDGVLIQPFLCGRKVMHFGQSVWLVLQRNPIDVLLSWRFRRQEVSSRVSTSGN